MSEQKNELKKKLIEKMRTHTVERQRKTEAMPMRRTRRRVEKVRHKEGPQLPQ